MIAVELVVAGEAAAEVGAAVSTVKARWAGVGSVLAAASVARTSKLWGPSLRVAVVSGEEQGAKGAPYRKRTHQNTRSGEEKPKVGVGSPVAPWGPESIVVSGGVVSSSVLESGEPGAGS